eukprot:4367650-Pyramimonas_sp.AAC.1
MLATRRRRAASFFSSDDCFVGLAPALGLARAGFAAAAPSALPPRPIAWARAKSVDPPIDVPPGVLRRPCGAVAIFKSNYPP